MLKIQKSEKNNKLRSSFSSGLGTPKRTGSAIKNNVTNVLSKKYGYQNTKHLFDGIGDKDIEDNIETAESTIKTNIDRGFLKGDYSSTLPYLCDGLALSYAAAGMGKGRAATRAREAAYTEFEPLIKSTENNLLTTELPKIKEEVSGKNEKPFFTKLIGNPKEEPKLENALYRVGEHGKTQIENALYRVGENEKSQLKNALYQVGEDSRITKLKNAAFRQKDNEKEETSSFGNNAPKPDEALSEIKKSGKMTGFGGASWGNGERKNAKTERKEVGNIYSGNIHGNEPPTDLYYSDLNKEQLTSLKGVTHADWLLGNDFHEFSLKNLGNLTSVADKKMNTVVNDMIEHFFDGTGTDYSNSILTEKVEKHGETQRYMKDFSDVLQKQLQRNGGDITKLKETDDFRNALKESGVLLSKYDYFDTKDKFNGLTMAVHSWTESDVDVKAFDISDDGNYSGTLTFTFKDNFGLDEDDVEKFGKIPGFSSWFTLQHDYRNSGEYKPFKTVVKIDYPISGKIEGYKNE